MTDPSQYFRGRTVQEQMNEVIGYVDVRSAEVATDAIAADVAQVHQDMLDADADATAAAASAAAAAGTLANAVKKTGEASQSIAGDIAVSGDETVGGDLGVTGDAGVQGQLSVLGGCDLRAPVTVPTPTNNTDAATKKYVDDADALKLNITDVNSYAVGLTGNQTASGEKIFATNFRGMRGFVTKSSQTQYKKFATIDGSMNGNGSIIFIGATRGVYGMFSVSVAIDLSLKTITLTAPASQPLLSLQNTFYIGADYDSQNNVYRLFWRPATNNVNAHIDVMHATLGTGNNLVINNVTLEEITPNADYNEVMI